ncbi:MAG: N-6 DNA methylase, partial [Candidatus Microthrix parvicella]
MTDHLAGGAAAALDPPPGAAICDLLGPLYELMLADAVRRSAGVHFTSPALASGLVNFAASIRVGERFRTGEVVLDPACGAGAFLVAAARHLWVEAGADGRSTSVGGILSRRVGADLDPDVLVGARAALARWALDEADAPGADEAVARARASG